MRCFKVFHPGGREVVGVIPVYIKYVSPLATSLSIFTDVVEPWNEKLARLVLAQVPLDKLVNSCGKPRTERVLADHFGRSIALLNITFSCLTTTISVE